LDELPDWLPDWCRDHLGGEPAGVLFQSQQVSMVFGLRLAGVGDVVVKAAPVGAASGSFASAGPPTLAPIESSEAFLAAYQETRGRLFTAVELEIAWAGSLWMAAYNAREMALCGDSPVGGEALRTQAAERLRRANA
jgi:hypothetical protein